MSKKLISLLLTVCMLLCLSACETAETNSSENNAAPESQNNDETTQTKPENNETSSNTKDSQENDTSQTQTSVNQSSTSTTNQPIVERRLSADYRLLCCGTDGSDYYEVVYKEEEDYTGVTRYAGLIKNNEWFEELSETSPFLYREIAYVGKGCFMLSGNTKSLWYDPYMCIYNVKNKKKYLAEDNPDYLFRATSYRAIDFINSDALDEELLIVGIYINKIKLLNKSTMQTHDIELKTTTYDLNEISWSSDTIMNNICDGVFSIAEDDSWTGHGRGATTFRYIFFDINGNEILNLREYSATRNDFYFKNGQLKFGIRNSNDTNYTITIDKEGNVIDSKQGNSFLQIF